MAMSRVEQSESDLANLCLQENDNDGGGCAVTLEVFQELVEKRKAERKRNAEEKRQEGLKRIEEMKSDREMDPLLPKQIWPILLEEDKDITPQKRAMIYSKHPTFRDLLEENKIRDILFPLVLDYKIPFLDWLLRKNYYEPLDIKQLGILRLASKEIKESVDKWIEEDILNSMRTLRRRIPWKPTAIKFSTDKAKANLSYIESLSKGNPILMSRSLKVEFDDFTSTKLQSSNPDHLETRRQYQESLIAFKDHVTELLKKVGDQILYFNLSFLNLSTVPKEGYGLNITQIYSILRLYLLLMPNLKWLVLTAEVKIPEDPSLHLKRWLANAQAAIQAAPVPRMDKLERVDIGEWKDFPLWNTFLSANSHVKYHDFDGCGYYPVDDVERYADSSVLSLPLEAVDAGTRSRDFTFLQQVSDHSNWKLKRLTLRTYVFEIDECFRCLEKFPTLEDFNCRMDSVIIGEKVSFLKLPNLKNFNVDLGSGLWIEWSGDFQFFFSLQFLLHCSKLESLTWEARMCQMRQVLCKMEEMGLDSAMIDFKGGLGDLRTPNNIWDVFPLLKCVDVRLWDWNEDDEDDDGEECRRKYRCGSLVYEENPRMWNS